MWLITDRWCRQEGCVQSAGESAGCGRTACVNAVRSGMRSCQRMCRTQRTQVLHLCLSHRGVCAVRHCHWHPFREPSHARQCCALMESGGATSTMVNRRPIRRVICNHSCSHSSPWCSSGRHHVDPKRPLHTRRQVIVRVNDVTVCTRPGSSWTKCCGG